MKNIIFTYPLLSQSQWYSLRASWENVKDNLMRECSREAHEQVIHHKCVPFHFSPPFPLQSSSERNSVHVFTCQVLSGHGWSTGCKPFTDSATNNHFPDRKNDKKTHGARMEKEKNLCCNLNEANNSSKLYWKRKLEFNNSATFARLVKYVLSLLCDKRPKIWPKQTVHQLLMWNHST